MSKWKCEKCGATIPCVLDYGEASKTNPSMCVIGKYDPPDWQEVKGQEPVTDCNQLPKLTAEVFNRPDCPVWAKYAAVDSCRDAFFYMEKPHASIKSWGFCKFVYIDKFDPTDWQNSLIKRPAKLPEWCKVGEWVWVKSAESYEKITEITCTKIATKYFFWNVEAIGKTVFQTLLRPWTFEEAPAFLKCKDKDGELCFSPLCFDYVKKDFCYYMNGKNIDSVGVRDFREVAENYTQLDGSPCGVLEHFDPERGEWVK